MSTSTLRLPPPVLHTATMKAVKAEWHDTLKGVETLWSVMLGISQAEQNEGRILDDDDLSTGDDDLSTDDDD